MKKNSNRQKGMVTRRPATFRLPPDMLARLKTDCKEFGFESQADYLVWLESFRPSGMSDYADREWDNPDKNGWIRFYAHPFTFYIIPPDEDDAPRRKNFEVIAQFGSGSKTAKLETEAAAKKWCAEWARERIREIMLIPDSVRE